MPDVYTGKWRRSQYYEVPSAIHAVGVDEHSRAQHSTIEGNPPDWKGVHGSPEIAQDPQYETIGSDLWQTDVVNNTPGVVVDLTPTDHMHRGGHMVNEGTPEFRQVAKVPHYPGPGETYTEKTWKDFGPKASEISYTALMRGINSSPINNPPLDMYDGDGFRYGFQKFFARGRDRKLLVNPIIRGHGSRAVQPNTAYIPPASAYAKNVPLWGSLANVIDKRRMRPMIRRSPTPISDVIAEDGTSSPSDSASIIGAFF